MNMIDNVLQRWKEALARQDEEKQARLEILANGTPEQKREQQAKDRNHILADLGGNGLVAIFLFWLR